MASFFFTIYSFKTVYILEQERNASHLTHVSGRSLFTCHRTMFSLKRNACQSQNPKEAMKKTALERKQKYRNTLQTTVVVLYLPYTFN